MRRTHFTSINCEAAGRADTGGLRRRIRMSEFELNVKMAGLAIDKPTKLLGFFQKSDSVDLGKLGAHVKGHSFQRLSRKLGSPKRCGQRSEDCTAKRVGGSAWSRPAYPKESIWLDAAPPGKTNMETVDYCCEIAIVGGGFSGALTAIQLFRQGFEGRLIVLEMRPTIGRGLAYSTPFAHHLLNVPASHERIPG